MLLIWRRWGILVVLLALLGLGTGLIIHAGFQSVGIVHGSHRSENLFAGFGWVLGGGYIWLFDRYVLRRHLDKPRLYNQTVPLDPPRLLPDGQWQLSVERPVLAEPPQSTLFFVPFKYWSIVLVALGVLVIVINAVRPAF